MTPEPSAPWSTPSAPAGGVLVPPTGPRRPPRTLRQVVGPATLLAGVLTVAAGGALTALYQRYLRIESRGQVIAQTVPYGQALGAALAHRVAVLEGFEAFLRVQNDRRYDDQLLQRYTEGLQAGTRGIRALQLVRDGKIVAIAPRIGNEGALGVDLRKHPDPEVRAKWHESETTDRMTVTGPRLLLQGGQGLIFRRRFPRAGGNGYDMAALVLDLDPLLDEAGLGAPVGVRVAIRDSSGRLLVGPADVDSMSPVEVAVHLPDNVWRLQAVPTNGWVEAIRLRLFLFSAGVFLSGVLFVMVVYLVASRQAMLMASVEERTGSLRLAVEDLREAAAQRELTEAQLRQSQRLESLGRLAGGIAHDFNNLLTVIMGSISLARETIPGTSEAGADLTTAEHAAQRASELTRKLLVFARRQTVEFQVVDLNALLKELETIVHRLLGERIKVVDDLAPGLWPVYADPGQLEQMVTNLTVNARDAMPDGGTLTIRTRNVELARQPGISDVVEPGEYVRLEVEDTGAGMPPEVLQRVFEPFFTTKEVGQGTGLGLATVYGLVRQAGGEIAIKSDVGRGTRATIHLPRARVEQMGRTEGRSPAQSDDRGGGGETVLLVEDEAPVRKIASRILGEAGYRVIAAEDGDSALRRLDRSQRIHLLVADVVTPGMGGRALAERILGRDPTTRVLFISGYTADERLEELLARPGVAFLAKPFTARQLQRAVRQLLDFPPRG